MSAETDKRVQAALNADLSDSFILQYLGELRTNMGAVDREMRRTLVRMSLLVIVFILLTGNDISEVNVQYFKLSSIEFIAFLIPPAVAYLDIQLPVLLQDFTYMSEVHDQIVALRYPSVYAQDLHVLLGTPANSWSQATKIDRLYSKPGRPTTLLVYFVGLSIFLPEFLANLVLYGLIAALFVRFGWSNVWCWVCAAVVGCLLIVSYAATFALDFGANTSATESSDASAEAVPPE